MIDYDSLTLEELDQIRIEVAARIRHLTRQQQATDVLAEVVREVQKAREPGAAWSFPITPAATYMADEEVTHKDTTWISTHDFNSGEPGVSGWREKAEVTEDGETIVPEFRQPAGAHDAYQEGEFILWEGKVYAATRDGVVHTPTDSPSDWEEVQEAPEETPEEPGDGTDPTEPGDGTETPEEPTEPGDGTETPEEPTEPEETAPPEWDGNQHAYELGDILLYQGVTYRVRQPHTSQAGWTPDAVPALYEVVTV